MKKVLSIFLSVVMLLSVTAGLNLTANAEKSYSNGDLIEFGSYPQSEVTDSSLISSLDAVGKSWVSYGYYSGDGSYGSMKSSDYMKYADISYGSNKYRAVKFTEYRPYNTGYTHSASDTFQDDNGYYTNNTYYFKYEPLVWRILDTTTGMVMSESLIDSQAYSNTIYYSGNAYYNDSSYTHYANDYATSSIREWLNTDFYNTAFSSKDKKYINTTELDNSAYLSSRSEYDSETTYDGVYLMSYKDACNSSYFSSSATKEAKGTDYAKCQGLSVYTGSFAGNSWWRLRSAGFYSGDVTNVSADSCVDYYFNNVYFTDGGIRPILNLNLKDFENSTTDSTNESTTEPDTKLDKPTPTPTPIPTPTPTTTPTSTPTPAQTTSTTTTTTATQAATESTTTSTVKKPKSTSIKSLKKGKKQIKATWKKVSGVKGYQVQVATDKKFKKNKKTVTIKKQKTTSTTIKKLKSNKKYYVRVRTYKTVNGKKVYSSWSKVKTVKTK